MNHVFFSASDFSARQARSAHKIVKLFSLHRIQCHIIIIYRIVFDRSLNGRTTKKSEILEMGTCDCIQLREEACARCLSQIIHPKQPLVHRLYIEVN